MSDVTAALSSVNMLTQVVRFRVQRSGLKTANHFILIGYYQPHVHKTFSPNG
ncbi:hypothetical protein D1AOALGA4SA_11900 [Olavius algarvensis Delta 1 endosymbiont]|nr:hypothetical protein D1AOALGA4SA_11900 [Olavius algarvensis Delta 1 endosymbiont]